MESFHKRKIKFDSKKFSKRNCLLFNQPQKQLKQFTLASNKISKVNDLVSKILELIGGIKMTFLIEWNFSRFRSSN